ncbi:metal-sensing transcriptional repressor, partial [Enterococcus faecium]
MSHAKEHQTDELLKRLNKIEGQVSGIKKMVVANKDYGDIMIQLN